MPEKTDEEIAKEVQSGDVESFALLMERYEPKLTRYGQRFLFDSEDVKDLVQEVFIKAYINIKSLDTDRRFSSWIYRIAHNEFINAVKKKTRDKIFFFDLDVMFPHPVAKETADKDVSLQEIKRMIDTCLEKVDTKYREPLILYYLEQMDYKEIADILQIPISTVGVRLSRGKAALKKQMKQLDPTYEG